MQCSVAACSEMVLCRGLCSVHYARKRRHGDPEKTLIQGTKKYAPREFIEESLRTVTDECIEWPFARRLGYARLGGQSASRVVCQRANGPAPFAFYEAAHSCGKGHLGCINHRHLSWKTPVQNQFDRLMHGTDLRGEAVASAKLDEAAVVAIRSMYAAGGWSQRRLGEHFGIAQCTVGSIISRKTWAHVREVSA